MAWKCNKKAKTEEIWKGALFSLYKPLLQTSYIILDKMLKQEVKVIVSCQIKIIHQRGKIKALIRCLKLTQ